MPNDFNSKWQWQELFGQKTGEIRSQEITSTDEWCPRHRNQKEIKIKSS